MWQRVLSERRLPVVALAVALAVFAADLRIPLGVAAGVPYVAVILLAQWHPRRGFILLCAVGCSALTVLGYFLSSAAGIHWMVLANRALALFVIWSAAFLCFRRKHLEADLRASKERAQTIIDNVVNAIITVDTEDRILSWNLAAERMFGWSAGDALGRQLSSLIVPEDRRAAHAAGLARYRVRSDAPTLDGWLDLTALRRDGTSFSADIHISPISHDGTSQFLCFVQDTTERRRREDIHIRFGRILDASSNEIFTFDCDTLRFVFVNAGARRNLGYTLDELKQRTPLDLKPDMTPDDFDTLLAPLRSGATEMVRFTTVHQRKDGTRYPAEVHLHRSDGGDVAPVFLAIVQDTTDRDRAEADRARLAAAIEQTMDMVVITDPDCITQYVNPAVEAVTGYRAGEMLGRKSNIATSGAHPAEFYTSLWDTLMAGRVWHGQFTNQRKDGTLYYEEASISPVTDAGGSLTGFVKVARNVTEELKRREQLRQRQKLETVGTLVGGIAHDFNNLLTPILGFSELLLEDLAPDHPHRRDLETVSAAAQRGRDLVRQILAFSRPAESERVAVEIRPLLQDVLHFVRSTLPTTIEIYPDLDTRAGCVRVDPTEFHQVVMNLCTNAAQAMNGTGGLIEVRMGTVDIDPDSAPQPPGLTAGPYVYISVRDTGPGMDADTLAQVFDPFFTTKPPGEGTGLGLSVVHGIVTGCDGAITVESDPGAGTTFCVYLPRMDTVAAQTPEQAGPIPRGTERVLIVDDEEEITRLGQRILSHLGYDVRTETDSVRALETFRADPGAFDLVITDHLMPHMTGGQLVAELLRVRPDLPIILLTGHSRALTPEIAAKLGVRKYLLKPVGPRKLGAAVREVLDAAMVGEAV